ncbi:methyltransferase domain-containing protein [Undibacterium piscinae]|uniref:Methyltransferase domain-containing protein n=1 Tax=Undibacterium piscinae TaxID=2495591 RepID=A0A6M4A7M5_9BURK|nr:methyltransferase domain-containing protein [Undibacterium piscinae]
MENLEAKNHPIIDLGSWFEQPAGCYIRAWEQARLDQLTADIFGYNALQIGQPQINALAASRMPHKWLTTTTLTNSRGNLKEQAPVAMLLDFAELPFASQSIDLVVLPHVLEFAAEPHQVLREVERILIPEGRLIISGFNRTSLWGARQMAGRLSGHHFLPKEGEFISATRMKDWLKLLNMEVRHTDFGCYAPPYQTDKWLQRFSFMEKIGERWWPYLGSVYMMQAIKRIKGMHLVGPVRKYKRLPRRQAVQLANKVHKQGK